jgi:hypothetical protein
MLGLFQKFLEAPTTIKNGYLEKPNRKEVKYDVIKKGNVLEIYLVK